MIDISSAFVKEYFLLMAPKRCMKKLHVAYMYLLGNFGFENYNLCRVLFGRVFGWRGRETALSQDRMLFLPLGMLFRNILYTC
jgi:hypothetical protein